MKSRELFSHFVWTSPLSLTHKELKPVRTMATNVPPFTIGALFAPPIATLAALSISLYLFRGPKRPICSPDAPKYDQSTYYGRWRQFVELVSPTYGRVCVGCVS